MKNLLLFMTDFYGYNDDIISEIKSQGYDVTWFLDKIKVTQLDRIYGKFNKKYIENKFDKYFEKCLEDVKEKNFDEILIIFGAAFIKERHINLLREKFPRVPIVYYAWDSVDNFTNIEVLLKLADYSYTFDPEDSEKYNANFLPLFYVKKDSTNSKNEYDVSTVMSFYVEKSESLNMILKCLPKEVSKNFYLRLRDKLYYYRLLIFKKKKVDKIKQYFKFDSLKREEVFEIFENSKAVLDCPLPRQRGLTMRTFEVLAMNHKLITTNENIKKYEFYSPDNIFVVNKETKEIPSDFFETEFNMQYSISDKYSLKNFVKTLTDVR